MIAVAMVVLLGVLVLVLMVVALVVGAGDGGAAGGGGGRCRWWRLRWCSAMPFLEMAVSFKLEQHRFRHVYPPTCASDRLPT